MLCLNLILVEALSASSRLFKRNIPNCPVFFGLGVSMLIRANQAKDDFLEIRGVGVDFQLPQ